ncbi:nuclear transport factor 2 family protein [Streptomyces lydicus]|uniref:nuclear transport factor 2 family protein n=1 Tax=Streptomyces lydicus TaxID=47763 RepID=UPI0037ABC1AA
MRATRRAGLRLAARAGRALDVVRVGRSGRGRGTNVLVHHAGTWQMVHEHLSA